VKKKVVLALSLLAMVMLGSSVAMAYDQPEDSVPAVAPTDVQGPNFIDENGNGVCDLAGTGGGYGPNGFQYGGCGGNFIDENGDGICDLAGTGQGFGPYGDTYRVCGENFIDEDGDGLCDLMGTGQGSGPQGRMGNGQGRGRLGNAQGARNGN
jgi:hypothetical protein